MKIKSFTPLIAGFALSCASVNAASIISESFSQDTSGGTALSGKAAGTGLSGNWSATGGVNIVNPTTLAYGDLDNSGGQLAMTGNNIDAFVTTTSALSDAGLLNNGATLWFSFMYSKTSSNGGNEKGGFAFGTERIDGAFNGTNMINGGNAIGAAITGGTITAGSWIGNGNVSTGTGSAATPNDTSLMVVGQINWGATGTDDEMITLYLQDTSNLGVLSSSISTKSMAAVDQTLFDTVSMTTHQSLGTVTYDEIRFGASYADVTPVPEPSSFALLAGCFGLAWVMVRRRS